MPFTLNGFGTMYYGAADLRPDGSYVTTEWITAIYVPLIPLRSWRLVQINQGNVNLGVYNSQSYGVVERLPILWAQVFRIWGFLLGATAWVAGTGWLLFDKLQVTEHEPAALWGFLGFVAVFAPPGLFLWWYRRQAQRSAASTSVGSNGNTTIRL